MKAKSPKKTSTVIITLTLTVVIVTSIIIGVILLLKNANKSEIDGTGIEVATGEFYDNGWDSSVVAEIKEGNVPIPVGFEYISGEKDTGLIVKNTENGKKYVWVPYEANPTQDEMTEESINYTINNLFEGKEAVSTNPDKLAEIQKYGGFYAAIQDYEEYSVADSENTLYLGDMTLEQYELASSVIQSQDAGTKSVTGSMMGKEEVESIVRFTMSQENLAISTQLFGGKAYNIGEKVYIKTGSEYYDKDDFAEWRDAPELFANAKTADSAKEYTVEGYQGSYYYLEQATQSISGEKCYAKFEALSKTLSGAIKWNDASGVRYLKYNDNILKDCYPLASVSYKDVPAGTKVNILKRNTDPVYDDWVLIQKDGTSQQGYIKERDLTTVAPETTQKPLADSVTWQNVTTQVFLKKGTKLYKDVDAKEVLVTLGGHIANKENVKKGTYNNETWYKTSYAEHDEVYIKGSDVKSTYNACYTWKIVSGSSTRYITEDGVEVRSDCSTYGELKTTLNKGTKVELISTSDDNRYAKIKVNGTEGYVYNNRLTETNPSSSGGTGGNGGTGGTTPSAPSAPTTPTTPTGNTEETKNTIPEENTNTEPPATAEPTPEETEPARMPAYTGEVVTIKVGKQEIKEEEVPEKWKGNVAKVVNGVPIPVGFEVSEYYSANPDTGLVIKQTNTKESESSHRICYVWVPVNKDGNSIESLSEAKEALNKIYTDKGLDNKTSAQSVESLPEELVNSVKEYGGFYISQGELGYDGNAKLYNRPRGMIESDLKGWWHVDHGNYFRYVPEENRNIKVTNVNYVAAESAYDGIISEMTMEKIHKVCEQLSTDSVTSHLTYGAEWDAVMLWLLKNEGKGWLTREGQETELDLTKTLLADSTLIGKYSGHMFNAALTNNVWGLGGNLAEITQEIIEGKIVVRGGSYSTLGTEYPIASRVAIDAESLKKSVDHGFRNCIYINMPEIEIKPPVENVINNTVNETVNNTENIPEINGITNTTNTVDPGTSEEKSGLAQLIDTQKEITDTSETVTDAEGKTITIPQGFHVTKDAYLIKDGVVISNTRGDQFVWIPVEDINEMYDSATKTGKFYSITKNGSNVLAVKDQFNKNFEPGVVVGDDDSKFDAAKENLQYLDIENDEKLEIQLQNEFKNMIQSVTKHKGFYIARYETGDMFKEPTVKKDSSNRINISWYESYKKSKEIPSGVYGMTGLIWGCQWDMMLKWLQSTDGTGNTLNNIEDLKNGTNEWTMEAFSNDARVYRDVNNASGNLFDIAGGRVDSNPGICTDTLASRAMMYIR